MWLFPQKLRFRIVQVFLPIFILYLVLIFSVLKDGKAFAFDFPSSPLFLTGSNGFSPYPSVEFSFYEKRSPNFVLGPVQNTLIVGTILLVAAGQEKEGILRTGKIRRVVDGDTVEFHGGERVRYIGIDSPELKKKVGKKWVEAPEPFGRSAFLRNRGLVEGREVQYEVDQVKRDDYQRLLVYLYVDGIMVNALLVREGLASVMLYPPNTKYAERLLSMQREAWEHRRGIWSGLKEY